VNKLLISENTYLGFWILKTGRTGMTLISNFGFSVYRINPSWKFFIRILIWPMSMNGTRQK